MAENDLYQLNVEGTVNGQLFVNTFSFVQTEDLAGFLGPGLINTFQASCFAPYLAILSTSATVNIFRAFDVVPGTAATAEETVTTGNVGTNLSGAGANQIAALISWRTDRSGKSFRGRSYFPSVPPSEIASGGIIASTTLTRMTAFRDAMMSTFGPGSSGSFRQVIISRYADGIKRPTPIGTLVTTGINRTVVATQRRRRLGVGA